MNIVKLVFSNIRKRKGANITFLAMIVLSALMLSISFSLMLGGANFYDKKVEELNSAHFTGAVIATSYDKDKIENYIKNYDGITDMFTADALVSTGTWKMKSGEAGSTVIFYDQSLIGKSFQKIPVIDKKKVGKGNAILPMNFKIAGFKSGEKIVLNAGGTDYEFIIKGFFEDAATGGSSMSVNLVYIDNYSDFESDGNFTPYIGIAIRFDDSGRSSAFAAEFIKFSKFKENEMFVIDYESSKSAAMMFVDILSVLLLVFSMIILLIAFVVAQFSINNTMQEDIATIGALKSIGYKTKTLRSSQLLQYLIISLIGSLVGTIASLLTFGFIGNIIASTSGLLWLNGANIIPVIISIVLICGITSAITQFITRKYKKITPINALRQGDSNHSFKKNIMPLSKQKMPLNFHLGIKRCVKNMKNNITLFLIASLLVFVSAFVFTVSYNLNTDTTAMVKMVGLEMAEVWVQPDPTIDTGEIDSIINSHQEVFRTVVSGNAACTIDEADFHVAVVEDFSQFITNTVYRGVYPKLDNEIALSSIASKALNKGIGDTVTVDIDGVTRSYIVVGLTQDIGNQGMVSNITLAAARKHDPEFKNDRIYVYLNDGVNANDYIETLKGLYGNKIMAANSEEQLNTILGSLGGPFAAVSVVMIVITVIVIAFVLFLLISALIRKEKREMGIMKAIGYKNSRLILQILISMLPPLILGTIFGTAMTFVLTNPLLSEIFGSMGIINSYFIIPVLPTILIGAGIFAANIFTAYSISLRLRKISPHKLITE